MKTCRLVSGRWLVLLAVPFLACTVLPSAWAGPSDVPYKIGIIPFFTPEKIYALYSPFVDYLNRSTQYRWELVLGDTHPELMDKLARSEVSIALLGPIPYAQVRERVAVRPLLVTLTPSGETLYHSIIVTADPTIGSLADLKGRKFAFFPGSTAAHYVPLSMLAEEGVVFEPSSLHQCVSQDRLVNCVLNGEVAAGGIKEALFKKLNDPRLKALKTSKPLPQFVFAASPNLSAEVADTFVTVLLGLKPLVKQADRDLMKGWDAEIANGFALPEDDYSAQTAALLRSVAPFLK